MACRSLACGSSPRVWGARFFALKSYADERLIPTCVGSTSSKSVPDILSPAHPHVCGEHPTIGLGIIHLDGSSPRVWGAPSEDVDPGSTARLIPTCVGSTNCKPVSCVTYSAHPHVCGEHNTGVYNREIRDGSSPRVWGAHLLTWDFIPTHQVLELVWSPKPVLTLHDFWAYRRREARLYLLALLHPFRGPRSSFGADGRIISFTPSKSTGSHG